MVSISLLGAYMTTRSSFMNSTLLIQTIKEFTHRMWKIFGCAWSVNSGDSLVPLSLRPYFHLTSGSFSGSRSIRTGRTTTLHKLYADSENSMVELLQCQAGSRQPPNCWFQSYGWFGTGDDGAHVVCGLYDLMIMVPPSHLILFWFCFFFYVSYFVS